MKQFLYKVLDRDQKSTSGIIESLGEKQAVRMLQERDLTVIYLREKRDWKKRILAFFKLSNKVSEKDVAIFTRLLATMLLTGLPLVDALANLALQVNGYFREVVRSIQTDVQSGVSLSEAMSHYPDVFDNLYVNLLKAGEASGKVGEVLSKLADTLESNLDFKSKIQGALLYPAIIVFAMTGIAVFMLTVIIPQIASVYKQFNADLPLPTKLLIGFSSLLVNYFPLVLLFIIFLVVLYRIIRSNPVGDFVLTNSIYLTPIFGKLREDTTLAILNRTLGTLLSSGVAILDGLKIVAATMANDRFRVGMEAVSKSVEKGIPLSLALRQNPVFPLIMAQLCAIGEETGTVDQSLVNVAKFYEDSAQRRVKVVTTAMEPLMILLMGVGVGGFAIAVLLPMFNLANVIH